MESDSIKMILLMGLDGVNSRTGGEGGVQVIYGELCLLNYRISNYILFVKAFVAHWQKIADIHRLISPARDFGMADFNGKEAAGRHGLQLCKDWIKRWRKWMSLLGVRRTV